MARIDIYHTGLNPCNYDDIFKKQIGQTLRGMSNESITWKPQ